MWKILWVLNEWMDEMKDGICMMLDTKELMNES